jgi:hypothetical protein
VIVILSGLSGLFFIVRGIRVLFVLSNSKYPKSGKSKRVTFLFVSLGMLLLAFTVTYPISLTSYIGVAFPGFAAWHMFMVTFGALANAIVAFTLSPFVLRSDGANATSIELQSLLD